MSADERKALAESFLGKKVNIKIDRPIGYIHRKEKYDLIYPINYGYIQGVVAPDGETEEILEENPSEVTEQSES